jgi:hypothetical protein
VKHNPHATMPGRRTEAKHNAHVSYVANILLMVSGDDAASVPELDRWLQEDAPWREPSVPPGATGVGSIRQLTNECWGGWKNPECRVWAGVLNHADLSALIEHVGTMPWAHPEAVQLLIQDQEETYFRLWTWRGGRMRQCAPEPSGDDDAVY